MMVLLSLFYVGDPSDDHGQLHAKGRDNAAHDEGIAINLHVAMLW